MTKITTKLIKALTKNADECFDILEISQLPTNIAMKYARKLEINRDLRRYARLIQNKED